MPRRVFLNVYFVVISKQEEEEEEEEERRGEEANLTEKTHGRRAVRTSGSSRDHEEVDGSMVMLSGLSLGIFTAGGRDFQEGLTFTTDLGEKTTSSQAKEV